MVQSVRAGPRGPGAFGTLCQNLAFIVPLLVGGIAVTARADWRNDIQVVRSLGLLPVSAEAAISSVLVQLATLLPLGTRSLRAGLVGVLGLALVGYLVFFCAVRLLTALDGRAARVLAEPKLSPLNALLALSAALCATLTLGAQTQISLSSAVPLAVALSYLALLQAPARAVAVGAQTWAILGALAALVFNESHAVGVALVLGLGLRLVVFAELPSRRALSAVLLSFAAVTLVCLLPALCRTRSETAWLNLGLNLVPQAPEPIRVELAIGALASWARDSGIIAVAFALFGVSVALIHRRLRWHAVPLVAFLGLDLLGLSGALLPETAGGTHLLASASLALFGSLGMKQVLRSLHALKLPFAEPAAVLLVVFHLSVGLVAIERARPAAELESRNATDAWTEQALSRLPPRSLVLVRDPSLSWRMWAARVTRGERPDVVIVPMSLLDRGKVATDLVALEPALIPVIREASTSGVPSEQALSALADVRHVFVEFDPHWDSRLLEHLRPAHLWLEFTAHPLGRSDRLRALEAGQKSFRRVFYDAKASNNGFQDDTTLSVLARNAKGQALLLAALGDREGLQLMLRDLKRIKTTQPFTAELKRRLAEDEHGRLNVAGLLN